MTEFLTTKEAAEFVRASHSLIQKRCKDGTLPALRVGSDYRIQKEDLEAWLRPTGPSRLLPSKTKYQDQGEELLSDVDAWLRYLSGVKALSPDTIKTHQRHLRGYLRRMAAASVPATHMPRLFERKTLMAVFGGIPAKSYAVKYNTYNALISFGKFLIDEGKLQQTALDEVRTLKPRRQVEPRRTHLKSEDIPRLFDVIFTRSDEEQENVTLAAMVAVMLYSGLRVSEVCNLNPRDVDLASRVLVIRNGKGGKERRVGINNSLFTYLASYAKSRRNGPKFFLQTHGAPFDRDMLSKRLKSISKRLGVDITCHGLRRTFATLAANQGRSINSIRIALGHSNLETTQAYLRTSEAEVVESMKDW